jgi:metal-dependent amidase/aminoacylase/carboxypeptidase family protein
VDHTSSSYRVDGHLQITSITPPTINDAAVSEICAKSVEKLFGRAQITTMEKVMGGEDFAYLNETVPGIMVFVGIRNEDKGIMHPHHHEKFDIDEDALAIGTALHAQFAVDYLKN